MTPLPRALGPSTRAAHFGPRRRAYAAWGAALVVGAFALAVLLAAPAAFAQDEDPEALLQQIDALLQIEADGGTLTDAQVDELDDLLRRYEKAMAKQKSDSGEAADDAPPTPAPKPTPRPTRTPRPRATPVATPADTPPGAESTGAPAGGTRGTRPPVSRTPSGRTPPRGAPVGPGVEVEPELNVDADRFLKRYDERTYKFSIKDGTYADLIEVFARMASLPVIGNAPAGTVTFVSNEEMDFRAALGRVQMLLFGHPDQYWVLFNEKERQLEMTRVAELPRILEEDKMFLTLSQYQASHLGDNELAILLYTPESGSIAELEPLRDYMPDYVRINPIPEKNAQTVFGLVRDINKYLVLIKKFGIAADTDPRIRKIIKIEHVLPSQALETLKQLIRGFDAQPGAPAPSRRPGQDSVALAQARGIDAIPFDERGEIFVRAMPKKIEEIEEFLKYIDVPAADPGFAPVVVRLQYARAGDVLTLVQSMLDAAAADSSKPATPRRPTRRTTARGKTPAPQPAATAEVEDLTMIEWQPANAIILLGAEEKVARARELIERFDVRDETGTTFVELQHREPDELVALLTQLLQTAAPDLVCTADSARGAIALTGPPNDVAKAKELLAQLDVETGPEAIVHTIKLRNVKPSTLLGILTTWDADATASPAPAPAPRGKATPPRPTRRVVSGGSKFQANDDADMLYVICTDEEWDERYKPLIERLDAELAGTAEYTVLPLAHIDGEEAITNLQPLFAAPKGGAAPKFLAVPDGLMVMEATPAQIDSMKQIVAKIDVPDVEVRRVFELLYADPAEVVQVLESSFGGAAAPAAPRRGRAAAPAGSKVRFAQNGDRLWVWAPAREMDQIAEMIAELDVPAVERELRQYEFAVGTNVTELAETLRSFFPASGAVARPTPATPGRANRPRRPVRTAPTGGDEQILIVPQPETRKLFVSAPVAMFEEIEETIEMLRPAGDRPGLAYEFFEIQRGDPSVIADLVLPIMNAKLEEVLASGELPTPAGKKPPTLTVTADPGASRIIVAAPSVLMPEIATLVEQLEKGGYDDFVVRPVTLSNADAGEMAATINAMLSGQAAPPRAARRGPRQRGAAPAAAVATTARTDRGVTVVAAPGNEALVLSGPTKDVDEVESWVKLLDAGATTGKMMKVYQLVNADVEQLADTIMTVLDTAAGGRPVRKASSEDSLFGDLLDMGGPRAGVEISLTTDYFTNTMIVWASPRKMAQVDELVALYEGGEEGGPTIDVGKPLPSMTVELQYADAYNAKYDVESWIDVIWDRDKPKVEYVPFTSLLVVKSKNPDEDFPKVRDYIAEHIDKVSEGSRVAMETVSVKGAAAQEVAKVLLSRLTDVDAVIEGLQEDQRGWGPEQLKPEVDRCVLPGPLVRSLEALSAAALAQAAPPPGEEEPASGATPAPTASPAPRQSDDDLIKELLRRKEPDEKETADEAEKQPLRIRIDPHTNKVILEGSPKDVARAREELKAIQDTLNQGTQLPDIRVWRLKYVDPNVVAQVLQSMFNAGGGPGARGGMTPQQIAAQRAAMQRQVQQLQQQMQQGQQQPAPGQAAGEEEGGRGGRRGGREEREGKEAAEAPAAPEPAPSIQVFPYPALHAIIIKAPTEMYPAIEELVATIDRRTEAGTDYRFFKVRNQLASDVEKQLKIIFGIDKTEQQARQRVPARVPGGDQAAAAVAQLWQQQFELAMAGTEGVSGSAESITIASNDTTNTVLVRGPQQILDLSEKIIEDIETHKPEPKIEVTYALKFADAGVIVPQLEKLFGSGGGRRGKTDAFDPSDVDAIFIADTFNNAVVVRALEEDLPRIEAVIAKLDLPIGDEKVLSIEVVNGDAVAMAKTLEKIYGMGKAGRGAQTAKRIQFEGDESSNTIFVSAPPELRDEIRKRIADMDLAAGQSFKPKFIELKAAPATVVARVIEESFGARKRGSRIKITGDDTTKRLMVVCPDEVFPQIETLARDLDVPPDIMDIRVFQLKYARAPEVLKQMNDMVRSLLQQIAGKNVQLDPFSASADERSNSLVVMGGPITFALVERVLTEIDIPEVAPLAVRTMVVALSNSRANEVAQLVNNLFRDRKDGIDPPRAESNNSTNTLLVRGTDAQLKEIQEQVISKLEEFTSPPEKMLSEAVMPLQFIQADEAAEYLNKWFNDRKRAFDSLRLQGIQPAELTVSITPEPGSNQLVVMASADNLERIRARLADIDKEGAGSLKARGTQVYAIRYADPNGVNGAIQNAFRLARGGAEKDRVDSSVEWATQSVVVTASEANQEAVAALIAQLDKENTAGTMIRQTYAMKAARASQVAGIITQAIRETRQSTRQGRPPVSVVPNDDLNLLVITGTQKEIDEITPLIAALDALPDESGRQVKMFTLKYVDAGEMQTIVEDYLSSSAASGRGRGGQALAGDVRITAVPSSNSLVVTGTAEGLDRVTGLIERIDVEVEGAGTEPKIIKLEKAFASEVEPTLTKMFIDAVRGGRGGRGSTSTIQTVIVADDATNSLIIRANAADYQLIERLARALDSEEASGGDRVKLIQVATAFKVADLAPTIEATLRQAAPPSGAGSRGGRRDTGQVSVEPILASNSLLIAGDPKQLAVAEAVIKQIQEMGPAGGKRSIIINTKNMSADELKRVIEELIGQNKSQATPGSRPRGGRR